jgi:hypothetical protein
MRMTVLVITLIAILFAAGTDRADAGGKIGLYGIYMNPYGIDAKDYSRPGWGIGAHVVLPVPQLYDIVAGVGGIEVVNLLSQSFDGYGNLGGASFPYTQETNQNFFRLYIGGQVGGHGTGFFRPHAGLNIAWVFYGISTDVVIKDDNAPDNEIRKNQSSITHGVAGYDLTVGLDLNFSNRIAFDAGVRYLKSFSLPQQLGEGSVTVYPQYVQLYLGIGVPFEVFQQSAPEQQE